MVPCWNFDPYSTKVPTPPSAPRLGLARPRPHSVGVLVIQMRDSLAEMIIQDGYVYFNRF